MLLTLTWNYFQLSHNNNSLALLDENCSDSTQKPIKNTATCWWWWFSHMHQLQSVDYYQCCAEISLPSLSQTVTPSLKINEIDFHTLIQPDWFLSLASCKRLIKSSKKHSACTNNFKKYLKWVQVSLLHLIFLTGRTIFTLALTRPHLFRSSEVYSALTQTFSSFAPHLPCPHMLQWALQRKQTAEPWY